MDLQTGAVIAGTSVSTFVATLMVARLLTGSSWNLSGRLTSIEGNVQGVQITMRAMQDEIKRQGDIMERIADLKGDIRVMDTRVSSAEQDIRDLQRGEGKVLPLNKSAYEVP